MGCCRRTKGMLPAVIRCVRCENRYISILFTDLSINSGGFFMEEKQKVEVSTELSDTNQSETNNAVPQVKIEVKVSPMTPEEVEAQTKPKLKKKYNIPTVKIAYIAVLAALNIALSAVSPRIGTFKITPTYTLCFLAGYFFGPFIGIAVGGIGDVLGTIINGNVPNPIILAASCLLGAIPGLVRYIRIKKLGKFEWIFHLILSFVCCYVACSLFINTYALYMMGLGKGASFWVYLGTRAATQSSIVAANVALSLIITPFFSKIYKATVKL